MKLFSLNLLFIFAFIFSSCNFSENSADSFDNSADSFKANPPVKILEITSNFSGLYWMNGEVLDFRLYQNGDVEYNEYPLQKTSGDMLKADEVKSLKQIKISENERKEIINILTGKNFSKIGNELSPQKSCIDASTDTKIKFQFDNYNKEIFIHHCDGLGDDESTSFYFKKFPAEINELFRKLQAIKSRESKGKFYN